MRKKNSPATAQTDLWEHSREDAVLAVAAYPAWPNVHRLLGDRSRSAYPPVVLLVVLIASRIYGSQNRALPHLRKPHVWAAVVERINSVLDEPVPVPAVPPTAKVLDDFLGWMAEACGGTLILRLSEVFTTTSIGLARALGQFPGGIPRHHEPQARATIFGDGTYVEPYSKVQMVLIPGPGGTTTTGYLGSRATIGKPRVQQVETDTPAEDGKPNARGVNHVTVSTWTEYGTVALSCEQALGGEIMAARVALDRVLDQTAGTVHTVVWDGAIAQVDIERLLTRFGVVVVNKARARAENSHPEARILTTNEAIARHTAGKPLPLGTCVFETTKGHAVVNTTFLEYGAPDGVECPYPHHLYSDDGVLYEVARIKAAGHLYKVARAQVISARTMLVDGEHVLDIAWELPCPEQGHPHVFYTTTRPRSRRAEPNMAGRRQVERQLRPVARIDGERFARTYGLRNITESINSWFKGLLGNGTASGRAMRLDVRHQALDHICAMFLLNALTLERSRRSA